MAALVGYARVSGDSQKDNFSLPEQIDNITKFCKDGKHELVTIFQDVMSGERMDCRKGLQYALRMIQADMADGLVVNMLDRLTRSVMDAEGIREQFTARGKVFVSVKDPCDTDTADGTLMWQIKNAMAERERKRIKERCDFGRVRKRDSGEYVGGRPPYGFMVQAKKLIPVPHEQEVLRQIYEMHIRRELSPQAIARELNQLHILSKSGIEWQGTVVYRHLRNPYTTTERLKMIRVPGFLNRSTSDAC